MNERVEHTNEMSTKEEVSLSEIFAQIKHWFNYLKKMWWKILLISTMGALLGLLYAFLIPYTYQAKTSFVVEEGRSSTGGLASLASQFGFDIAGASSGTASLLYGENLLLFLKSNNLSKEVLTSTYDSAKNLSLADKYAEVYKLRKKWANSKKINQLVYFPVIHTVAYSRLQDSLLQVICTEVLEKRVFVERPEKKASFINVQSVMRDELLSKYYCERLVQKAVDKYVFYKIKRQKTNVDRLQQRADSIANLLNIKTFSSASDQEKILDVNPAARTATVTAEKSTRDKAILLTLFGEVVKNLEVAKVQLSQETPTIQMVDTVDLPLYVNKKSKLLWLIIGGLIFGMGYSTILIIKKFVL